MNWTELIIFQAPVPSDEDILNSNTLEELLSIADADTTDPTEQAFGHSEIPVQLQEHQYCLPAPNPYSRVVQTVRADKQGKTSIEPCFRVYDQIERSTRSPDHLLRGVMLQVQFTWVCVFILHSADIWATGFYLCNVRKTRVPSGGPLNALAS